MFETYLAASWGKVLSGDDILVELTCLDDATVHVAKVKIAQSAEALPGADELLVRTEDGEFKPGVKYAIKIVEDMDPDEAIIPLLPVTARPIYGGP
jgi:hypothetical protein